MERLNRRQRRANPALVGTALQQLKGLEDTFKALKNLQEELHQANTLAETVIEDLRLVNAEVELQKIISFRLLAHFTGQSEEEVQRIEAQFRAETEAELEAEAESIPISAVEMELSRSDPPHERLRDT